MGGGVSKQRCRPRDPPLTDRTLHPSLHRRIGRKGAWAMQRPTDDEKRARSLMLTSQLVAGGGAGAITKTSIAPLERIKILMQLEVSGAGGCPSHASGRSGPAAGARSAG